MSNTHVEWALHAEWAHDQYQQYSQLQLLLTTSIIENFYLLEAATVATAEARCNCLQGQGSSSSSSNSSSSSSDYRNESSLKRFDSYKLSTAAGNHSRIAIMKLMLLQLYTRCGVWQKLPLLTQHQLQQLLRYSWASVVTAIIRCVQQCPQSIRRLAVRPIFCPLLLSVDRK